MPQFIKNGPNIPERLLEKHEEGNVVFFCGAGISYPAGLPGYKELTTRLFNELHITPNEVQQAAICSNQYDIAIGLLERVYIPGRYGVRKKIVEILTPDTSKKYATTTHNALITLARNNEDRYRLITTNFDRLFEEVINNNGLELNRYRAPTLPTAKNRLDGLVYLHGLIPEKITDYELNNLIVASGDFGLAYLTERWASRFVSELFRKFTVCFIGYSLDDPVLRYMTDALAADQMLGEEYPEMFAFGSSKEGEEVSISAQWRAKNVTPILYKETKKHWNLHRTLWEWAKTYKDGVRGKQMIVSKHGSTPPLTNKKEEYAVGRVLWALKDELATKHFATLSPTPPLDWLGPLSENQYGHGDLSLFNVTPDNKVDNGLSFNFLKRPSPYSKAPRMSLISQNNVTLWDKVMNWIAVWLLNHLNDPELIYWIIRNGGSLHPNFSRMIQSRISKIEQHIHKNETKELSRLQETSKNAIPNQAMRTIWKHILNGNVVSDQLRRSCNLYQFVNEIKNPGYSFALRGKVIDCLTPYYVFQKPYGFEIEGGKSTPDTINKIVRVELELASSHSKSAIKQFVKSENWIKNLPNLIDDFTQLLRRAMDMLRDVGVANDISDYSYFHHPSVSDHEQNQYFKDWVILIDLNRDSWFETSKNDPDRAVRVAERWINTPYPVFKRLAYFAATQSDIISLKKALNWLLIDEHWWLWSTETQREVSRLLVHIASKLNPNDKNRLENAILNGPPKKMYKSDIDSKKWIRIKDRSIWFRLAKLIYGGAELSPNAMGTYNKISKKYPKWKVSDDERDEFPFWMSTGWDVEIKYEGQIEKPPRNSEGLIKWLSKYGDDIGRDERNEWNEICRDEPKLVFNSLHHFVIEKKWLINRWDVFLQELSTNEVDDRLWPELANIFIEADNGIVSKLSHPLSRWLKLQVNRINAKDDQKLFFELARKILSVTSKGAIEHHDDSLMMAINHPVGMVTEALIKCWYETDPVDEERLAEDFRLIFELIVNSNEERFLYGRTIIAAHIISFMRVDEKWSKDNFLFRFNWKRDPKEAKAIWAGFLWSPRLYMPLFTEIMSYFLMTANYYSQLGEQSKNYISLLVFASLDTRGTFSFEELARATRQLPSKGLQQIIYTLTRALEGTEEKREEYWHNRVKRYFKKIWPKTIDKKDPSLSNAIVHFCIKSEDQFPDAFEILKNWLEPLKSIDSTLHQIIESGLVEKYPVESLHFLDKIIDSNTILYGESLSEILDRISQIEPDVSKERIFKKLIEIVEKS